MLTLKYLASRAISSWMGHVMRRRPGDIRAGHAGLSEPHVRELVREREHLRRLRVCAIDEDQRREIVREREAAELLGG